MIKGGAIPYKDFPLLLPPLYPVLIAVFQSIFGESISALHAAGYALTFGIGITIYRVLSEIFEKWPAGLGASIGLMYYQSGNAFIGYDFTQVVTLLLLGATLGLVKWAKNISGQSPEPDAARSIFKAGLFLGLAILTKHSNAGMFTVAALATAGIAGLRTEARRGLVYLVYLAAGIALPAVVAAAWLASNGALLPAVNNLFTDAAAAKGGPKTIITNWLRGFFVWDSYRHHALIMVRQLAGLWLLTGVFIVFASLWNHRRDVSTSARGMAVGVVVPCAMAATIGWITWHGCSICTDGNYFGVTLINNAILFSVSLYFIGAALSTMFFLMRPTPARAALMVLMMSGLGLTFGNGTSAGLSEISAFLGVAFLFAIWFAGTAPWGWPAFVPAALAVALSSHLVEVKFRNPYHWWSIKSEDIRKVTCGRMEGVLAGVCVTEEKARKIKQISSAITGSSAPGDQLYVFPHMPIFHLLTERLPYRGAAVSWFDFMSDKQAYALAGDLLASPPKIIMLADMDELVLMTHERLFRGGKEMGQRRIIEAIHELARSGRIEPLEVVDDLDGYRVTIFVTK